MRMHLGLIKLGALGDVLRTTALLPGLRQKYPGARLTWVTRREALPLLRGNPFIDEALSLEQGRRRLRQEPFDLLVSMDEDPQACALATSARARQLVGAYRSRRGRLTYTMSSAAWFGMGRLNRDADGSLRQADHLKRENQRTYLGILRDILGLNGAGAHDGPRPHLVLTAEERASAMTVVEQRGIGRMERVLGFNPGAGERWPAKRLSPTRAAAIARALHRRVGARILLLGGPAERSRNRQIAQRAGGAVVDAGTRHGVRVFAALIERCALLVTSDSLALHLALALSTPVAAFFGPTAAQEVDVGGDGVKLLPAPPCRCFYARRCRVSRPCVDRLRTRQFVEAVATVEAVGAAAAAGGTGWPKACSERWETAQRWLAAAQAP